MKHSETIKEIVPALVAVQAAMTNVKKNTRNTFFNTTYADLGAVLEVVRPILANNKLALIQFAERVFYERPVISIIAEKTGIATMQETKTVVTTRLYHECGEYFETEVFSTGEPKNPQEFGSIVTYLRRYSILALCGTASEDEDDDAEVTSSHNGEDGKTAGAKVKDGKATGTKTTSKVPTIQEQMDALPKDLKDLLTKIGCNTLSDRWGAYRKYNGNVEEMKRAALAELKKREGNE